MVEDLASGTNISTYNSSEMLKYETGEDVLVTFDYGNSNTTCTGVSVSGTKCSSCSTCGTPIIENTNDTVTIVEFNLTADCTNVPGGIKVDCQPMTPVFYPLKVRNFETMCANNGGREFLTRYFLFVCSFRPTIRIPHRRLIPSFCAATLPTLVARVRTVRWLSRFLFVQGPIVLSLELTIFPM
jgi:hypothetical protein